MARANTKSESPVAARAELDQQDAQADGGRENLEQQAKDQEQQQKAELKQSVESGQKEKLVEGGNVAGSRRPNGNTVGAVNGFTDQLTRRNGREAMEGHFVTIDQSADGVLDAYKAAGLVDDDGNIVESAGNYGVYRTVTEVREEDGYPKTVVVRLQDATFTDVHVPYEALTHSASRGTV